MKLGTRYCHHLAPCQTMNTELPVVGIKVDVMTINGLSQACCGVGTVTTCDEKGDTTKDDVLVMPEKPLGYDLLLGLMQ